MADKSQNLEQSIQLALEAAAAANDTADEVSRLSTDTERAVDRLDKFGKGMKPALYGVLAGAILSSGLGGLVYMRTLAEMRTVAATQVEALAVFSKSVAELQGSLDSIDSVTLAIDDFKTAQSTNYASLEAMINPIALEVETDTNADTSPAISEGLTSQMLSSLPDLIRQSHEETREGVSMAVSDLQLAFTRMLANQPETPVVSQPAAAVAKKPVPVPVAAPRTKKRVTTPKKRPRKAAVAPNPFSYP